MTIREWVVQTSGERIRRVRVGACGSAVVFCLLFGIGVSPAEAALKPLASMNELVATASEMELMRVKLYNASKTATLTSSSFAEEVAKIDAVHGCIQDMLSLASLSMSVASLEKPSKLKPGSAMFDLSVFPAGTFSGSVFTLKNYLLATGLILEGLSQKLSCLGVDVSLSDKLGGLFSEDITVVNGALNSLASNRYFMFTFGVVSDVFGDALGQEQLAAAIKAVRHGQVGLFAGSMKGMAKTAKGLGPTYYAVKGAQIFTDLAAATMLRNGRVQEEAVQAGLSFLEYYYKSYRGDAAQMRSDLGVPADASLAVMFKAFGEAADFSFFRCSPIRCDFSSNEMVALDTIRRVMASHSGLAFAISVKDGNGADLSDLVLGQPAYFNAILDPLLQSEYTVSTLRLSQARPGSTPITVDIFSPTLLRSDLLGHLNLDVAYGLSPVNSFVAGSVSANQSYTIDTVVPGTYLFAHPATLTAVTMSSFGTKITMTFALAANPMGYRGPADGVQHAIPLADITRYRACIRDNYGEKDCVTVDPASPTVTLTLPVRNPAVLLDADAVIERLTLEMTYSYPWSKGFVTAEQLVEPRTGNIANRPASGYQYLEIQVADRAAANFDAPTGLFTAKAGDIVKFQMINDTSNSLVEFAGLPVDVWLVKNTTVPAVVCPNSAVSRCHVTGAVVSSDGSVEFTVPVDGRYAMISLSGTIGGNLYSTNLASWPASRLVERDAAVAATEPGGGTGGTAPATRPLNDTGIIGFADDLQRGLSTEPATHPGQDARYGRDAAAGAGKLSKVGGGRAGFDFSKIANDGSVLTESAVLGSGAKDWACTRDNVTGLIWEVKTTSGLRSQDHTYTSYDSNPDTNGGAMGTVSGGSCFATGRCDTEKFAQDVNAAGLCGASDWRMPGVKELEGIVDNGRAGPPIDTTYFPNTPISYFWSSSLYANYHVWYVGHYYGEARHNSRNYRSGAVRLVRGGQ